MAARRGAGLVLGANLTGAALGLGWLALTLGHVLWTGALWPGLLAVLPVLGALAPMLAALIAFALGVWLISIGLFALAMLGHLARPRRTRGDARG